MIECILTGGQSGSDLAAWRAAKRCGIRCSGWMPKGFLTEDGPRPEYAELYGAKEHASAKYPPRTRQNIREADFALIFDTADSSTLTEMSRGTRLAITTALDTEIPSCVARVNLALSPDARSTAWMAGRLDEVGVRTLFVGGHRESKAPGIGAWVERYLVEVFTLLGYPPEEQSHA